MSAAIAGGLPGVGTAGTGLGIAIPTTPRPITTSREEPDRKRGADADENGERRKALANDQPHRGEHRLCTSPLREPCGLPRRGDCPEQRQTRLPTVELDR